MTCMDCSSQNQGSADVNVTAGSFTCCVQHDDTHAENSRGSQKHYDMAALNSSMHVQSIAQIARGQALHAQECSSSPKRKTLPTSILAYLHVTCFDGVKLSLTHLLIPSEQQISYSACRLCCRALFMDQRCEDISFVAVMVCCSSTWPRLVYDQ